MTTGITFDGFDITTSLGHERYESFGDSRIVVIEGPAQVGKSSALDCLLFPLGHGKPSEFSRAVRDNVVRVDTFVTLGESSFRLARHLRKRPNRIDVYDTLSGELIEYLDVTGRSGSTPSDFLFQHMGLTKIFQGVTARSGSNTRELTSADYFRFLYADQMSVATDIQGHRQHDEERRLIFEICMGLVDAEVHQARSSLDRLQIKIRTLRTERKRNEEFVKATSKSMDELVAELNTAQRTSQEADEKVKLLQRELAALMPTIRRPRNPSPKQSGAEIESCPRCFADLRHRESAAACCALCLEPIKTGPTQIPPTDGQLATPGPDPDHPVLKALLEATEARGRGREAIEKLTQMLEPHRMLAELQGKIDKLKGEHDSLKAELLELSRLASEGAARLEAFEEMFVELVKGVQPPHYRNLAGLDFETYLPSISGDDAKVMRPGQLESANVIYRAALLRYTLLAGHTYFPSALIIDSPQGQRGSASDDRDYAQRMYSMFLDMVDTRGDLPGFKGRQMAPPRFQLIVVDNGVPPNVRGVKRIKLSYDNPLVPGIEYEAHELADEAKE